MAGNVRGWTTSEYDNGTMVLRGGSWSSNRDDARCALRDWNNPGIRDFSIGFRCVRT
jgi:formylglycine-generating enzyme required for sulfatase activity